MFRFSETESFDLSAALHAELGADGWWYAVGDGLLVPCESRSEVDELIANRKRLKSARNNTENSCEPARIVAGYRVWDTIRDYSFQPEEESEYALALSTIQQFLSSEY
jgi:hypothetical protein